MSFALMRKLLFSTQPETAHELAMEGLRLGHNLGANSLLYKKSKLPVSCMGLEFPNPVGLAAGMDKNGDYIDALGDLGFGFIEAGTVTPRPQPGNPKPRIFRVPAKQAIINRLGFNNKGIDHLVGKASVRRFEGILGINIGKNFDTPNERAVDDYLYCLERAYPHADYIAVNISSPNTQGLRDLQGAKALDQLLNKLEHKRQQLHKEYGKRVPMAVKLAPDIELDKLEELAAIFQRHEIDAVIATNTTIDHSEIAGEPHAEETGGLSGRPLAKRADEVLAALREALPAEIALMGVGGIMDGQDAVRKMKLGADLVQIYTGFIYGGPALVAECVKAMEQHLQTR